MSWQWYDDATNYGGSPPNAHAFIYHPQWGLHVSPKGGVHMQALRQVPRDVYYGLTEKGVFGRAFPYGNISGSMGPHGTIYQASGPHREEAKQAVEEYFSHPENLEMKAKTASLPHKFVWADGQMAVGPGWRKDLHHMHLMQELGLTEQPQNMYAGTYTEDPFSDRATIKPDWDAYGNYPSDEELIEQIRQRLRPTAHIGRQARRPW